MRSSLDLVWESLASPGSKIDFDKQLLKLEGSMPDPAQFDMYGVYPAIDCCVGLEILLELIQGTKHHESDQFGNLLELYYSTIQSFIEVSGAEDDALIQQADQYLESIEACCGECDDKPQLVKRLKEQVKVKQQSNIGLSLE